MFEIYCRVGSIACRRNAGALSNMASVLSPLSTARQSIGYTPQEPTGARRSQRKKRIYKETNPCKTFLYKICAIFFLFLYILV
jgi:hypothetical protein